MVVMPQCQLCYAGNVESIEPPGEVEHCGITTAAHRVNNGPRSAINVATIFELPVQKRFEPGIEVECGSNKSLRTVILFKNGCVWPYWRFSDRDVTVTVATFCGIEVYVA